MNNWERSYRPLLGHRFEALAWMPITCDTPGVVSDLQAASFSFSGGVYMLGEIGQVFLTWLEGRDGFGLTVGDESLWIAHALDRIHCSFEAPWEAVREHALVEVHLFALADDEKRTVVGARHGLANGAFFWVGTGGRDFIGDGDDLWIGAGVEPPNMAQLIELSCLA